MNRRSLLGRLGLVTLGSVLALPARAETKRVEGGSSSDKPFAEHYLALQLSVSDSKRERLVLSVASNILKVYGPDKVAVETVAFGPGIDLLRDNNEYRQLVDSLVGQGVRFDVCGNTLDTIERETGQRPKINPHAVEVQAGVEQLLILSESGYTVIRP